MSDLNLPVFLLPEVIFHALPGRHQHGCAGARLSGCLKRRMSGKSRFCLGMVLAVFSPMLPAQSLLYACPSGQGEAVYASEPLSVDCQPAKRAPEASVLAAAQSDALRRLWYQNEFSGMNDVRVLSRESTPALKIHLRYQPLPQPARRVATTPPPKPMTPKQLIQRDIGNERRALNRTRQLLQQAQQQGNGERMRALRQDAVDREASIRALQQELDRL